MSLSSLSDFEIGKILGKGAFGMVCLVKRKFDGKTYAMKRIKIVQLSDKEKENSLNEIRILASLSHKNIIGYKDAFFDQKSKTLNIVMEFADDGDISSKIKYNLKNKKQFEENIIWQYLIQILEGLHYLHEKKIIHRDLKSANIFLMKDNTVKIGDLNVSKINKLGMAHTQTGTPYYASPEIWLDQPYDYKSDIWSLGCILYELCQLKPPFHGTSLKNLGMNIQRGMYKPIPDNYSNELKSIIGMMLQKNPNQRPTTGQILGCDIIVRKINELKIITKYSGGEEKSGLIATIKVPRNLGEINKSLPMSKYNNIQNREEMLMEDEYETTKRQNGFLNENDKNEIKEMFGNNNLKNENYEKNSIKYKNGNNINYDIYNNNKLPNLNYNNIKYNNDYNNNYNNIISKYDINENNNNCQQMNIYKNNLNNKFYNNDNININNNNLENNNYKNINSYNNIDSNNNIYSKNNNNNLNYNNYNYNSMNYKPIDYSNNNISTSNQYENNSNFSKKLNCKGNKSMDERHFNAKKRIYNNISNNMQTNNDISYNQNIQNNNYYMNQPNINNSNSNNIPIINYNYIDNRNNNFNINYNNNIDEKLDNNYNYDNFSFCNNIDNNQSQISQNQNQNQLRVSNKSKNRLPSNNKRGKSGSNKITRNNSNVYNRAPKTPSYLPKIQIPKNNVNNNYNKNIHKQSARPSTIKITQNKNDVISKRRPRTGNRQNLNINNDYNNENYYNYDNMDKNLGYNIIKNNNNNSQKRKRPMSSSNKKHIILNKNKNIRNNNEIINHQYAHNIHKINKNLISNGANYNSNIDNNNYINININADNYYNKQQYKMNQRDGNKHHNRYNRVSTPNPQHNRKIDIKPKINNNKYNFQIKRNNKNVIIERYYYQPKKRSSSNNINYNFEKNHINRQNRNNNMKIKRNSNRSANHNHIKKSNNKNGEVKNNKNNIYNYRHYVKQVSSIIY